jgi:hypothetical protein
VPRGGEIDDPIQRALPGVGAHVRMLRRARRLRNTSFVEWSDSVPAPSVASR